MDDLISRRAAIDEIKKFQHGAAKWRDEQEERSDIWHRADSAIASALEIGLRVKKLPSAQQEPHYCRECKWSRCYINVVDKHGESEAYWRCINWSAETDEEGYCHEWKRRTDG